MKVCAQCGGASVDRLARVDVNDDTVTMELGTVECSECGECTLIDASEFEKRWILARREERTDTFGDDLVNECKLILTGVRS